MMAPLTRQLWRCGLALLLVLGGCHRLPEELSGSVVKVLDGDTIEVLVGRRAVRVRLHSVDCPERGQAFGSAARQFTSAHSFGKRVRLRTHGMDKYERVLADVVLPDDRVLNHELVKEGLAWWFRQYALEDTLLRKLESEARAAGRGLWADPQPVPPWEYRKSRRVEADGGIRSGRSTP